MKAYLPQRNILRALVAFAASIPLAPLTAQTTYTWDGNGTPDAGGNWSSAINWTSDHVPVTGGDIALLDNVSTGTRTVVYDSAASGSTSTVQFNQTTAGAINLLSIQKSFAITNAITLGATAGTAQITVDALTPAAAVTLTATAGLTLNTGGSLYLTGNATAVGNYTGNMTISGGTLHIAGATAASSVENMVNGSLTMASGSIVIENDGSFQADRRLKINGNATITGGSVTSTKTGGTAGFLSFYGATNIFNPTAFDSDIFIALQASGDQTLTTNQAMPGGITLRGHGVKTLIRTDGSTINQINFIDANSSGSIGTTLKLGSDLTLAGSAGQPFAAGFGQSVDGNGAIQAGIDTNGYTLDLSAGASSGAWTPNKGSAVTTTQWSLSNSGAATGGIKATSFNFSSSGVTVNVGAGVILRATGGTATANNLGSSGTYSSTSSFIYAGSAAAGTPATLTSARTIGSLVVQSGALKIITANFTAAGGITVNGGALLDFSAQTVSATTLTLEVSGATFGQIKTGATAYDFNALTFNITSAPAAGVIDLFNLGAGGAGAAPASVTLSGLYGAVALAGNSGVWTGDASGYHFSFTEATGDLTVSAIPEPSTFAGLAGIVAFGLSVWVRRRA